MQVNWMLVLLFGLAIVLGSLAVTGRYQQVWGALSSIPLTPAQAQAQNSQGQAPSSQYPYNQIG